MIWKWQTLVCLPMTGHEGDKVPPIPLYWSSLRAHLRQSRQYAVSLILYASARLSVPGWFMSWCHISKKANQTWNYCWWSVRGHIRVEAWWCWLLEPGLNMDKELWGGEKKEDLSRYKCVDICSNGLKLCPPHRYIYLCECDLIRFLQS